MNPRSLQNNEEVFEYLVQLGDNLQKYDHHELAEKVTHASRFVSGSASEFLHEAQLVLQQIANESDTGLSHSEMGDLKAVLTQINEAFLKIGGA